jgi:hypothetical protein
MSSIDEVKKHIPRCDQAFQKIIESVDLLKGNFNGYYKDYTASGNPTIIMENFVLDVSKNTKSSPAVTAQFRRIIAHYRKLASQQASNPKLQSLFAQVDANFHELEKRSKEADGSGDGDSDSDSDSDGDGDGNGDGDGDGNGNGDGDNNSSQAPPVVTAAASRNTARNRRKKAARAAKAKAKAVDHPPEQGHVDGGGLADLSLVDGGLADEFDHELCLTIGADGADGTDDPDSPDDPDGPDGAIGLNDSDDSGDMLDDPEGSDGGPDAPKCSEK